MAAKNPRGGRKAKAPNSANQAFVPSGYLSLGDAVAAAGKAQQRFDQTVGWLRDRLWSGVIPAVVLVASGTAYPMPPPIWGSDSAPAIFKTGNVEFQPETYGWRLGPTSAPLKGRVLIQQKHLDRALSGENTPPQDLPGNPLAGKDRIVEPPEPAEAERRQLDKRPRKRNVEANALLENSIKTVIAKAKTRWPDPETRPGVNQMARKLVEGEPNKKVGGYGEQAIRQILMGTYKPALDKGIPGLSG